MTVDLGARIEQYLTYAPSSLFAQRAVTLLDHWQGDANLLWRVRANGDEATVKLFLDAGQARSRRQFDGHRIFAPLGLAPEPLWADRYPHGLSRQLIVYRWLDGTTIDVQDPAQIEAWADAIAALHHTSIDEVQRFSPHPVNLEYYWRIERDSIAQIQRWLDATELDLRTWFARLADAAHNLVDEALPWWERAAPAPVHGDLTIDHTLVTRGRICLLDWEMFGLGDPALDVARLLQRVDQTLAPAHRELWCARYLSHFDDDSLAARVERYVRLLDVHNVIYLLVGLRQHSVEQADPALIDALPLVEAALSAALDRAGQAAGLAPLDDTSSVAAEVIVWIRTTLPTQG